ncbi:MAG: ABC transporter permease [Thermoplasmatales archaeon]
MDSEVKRELTKFVRKSGRRNPRFENYGFTLKLLLRNKIALAGLIIAIFYSIITILDYVDPHYLGVTNIATAINFLHGAPLNSTGSAVTPPTLSRGWYYYLGTTKYGIPILPAMFAALKIDITYTLVIAGGGAIIGTLVGSLSGFIGGVFDQVVMRMTDVFFSIPNLVLAIAIAFILGFTFRNIAIAFLIVSWPAYARIVRSTVLSLREAKFVEAAFAAGVSKVRILFSHLIPNSFSPVLVQFSLQFGSVIQLFAALAFLGFVAGNAFAPELGNMISWGETYLAAGKWWAITIPGIFLIIFSVGLNLLGDGLRDVLDPKLRS